MKHFLKWKLILPLAVLFFIASAIFGPMVGNSMHIYAAGSIGMQDIALAKKILSNPNIVLAKSHPGGKTDGVYCTGKIDHATAYCNIVELANGQKAARSSYNDPSHGQSGPGGSTTVQPLLLQIILAAAASGHKVGVNEIAGGVHPAHVAHYSGHAVDFSTFNGQQVTGRNQPSIQLIQSILPLLSSGSGIGQSQCGQTPPQLAKDLQAHHILTFPDSCGHVHIQVP
ncbi:MAG: hypothetical protein ABI396_06745 [Ktedonobacteraceae bacterium]